MIQVNGKQMGDCVFPDGTSRIMGAECGETNISELIYDNDTNFVISLRYDGPRDIENLIYITLHIKDKYPSAKITLEMPYVINARMDRTHNADEVFTLKYFAKLINWLGYDRVFVCDPHSNVSEALFDRLVVGSFPNKEYIKELCEENNISVAYFPDAGSQKRYKNLLDGMKIETVYGEKLRDFATGKILGLDIRTDDADGVYLAGQNVIMIDDIISYGGTFAYSADKLKDLGAHKVYAYATHTENSVLDEDKGTFIKRLNNGTVEKLFTTDSLFTGKHPKIEVSPIFFN